MSKREREASIDPVVQTIVSGGPIDVLAETAAAAMASILATGDQTILVTLGDVSVTRISPRCHRSDYDFGASHRS